MRHYYRYYDAKDMERHDIENERKYSHESDQHATDEDDQSQVSQTVKRKAPAKQSWSYKASPDDIAKSVYTRLASCYQTYRSLSLQQVIYPFITWFHAFIKLFGDKKTWSTGIFFLVFGLLCSFLVEAVSGKPNYNSAVLLAIMASIAYSKFPSTTIRPHLVITVLVTLSFALDIQFFSEPKKLVRDEAKVLTAMVLLSKIVAMTDFLSLSATAERARKYLLRRVRVFMIPFEYPRKPLRDIRARILAVEWLQFVSCVSYLILFFAGISVIGFRNIMTSPSRGIALVYFLPLKAVTSGIVFYGLYLDTDTVLCLSYFGCLGWCMKFVKNYVNRKREEYNGWPLSYGLNPYRFYAVTCLKSIDVLWGIGGWVTLGTTFGSDFYNMADNLIGLVSGCIFVMVMSDVWTPVLFYVIVWLIRQSDLESVCFFVFRMLVNLFQRLDPDHGRESDDSELEEMGILKSAKHKRQGSSSTLRRSNSSDSSRQRSSRKLIKKNSRSSSRVGAEMSSDDDHSDGEDRHEGMIDINLAMGESDSDNEGEHRHAKPEPKTSHKHSDQVIATADQFQSPRYHPQELPKVRVPHRTEQRPKTRGHSQPAAEFSPGKGSWRQAHEYASQHAPSPTKSTSASSPVSKSSRPPPPRRIMSASSINSSMSSSSLVVDDNPSISPDEFTEIWESLPDAGQFSCRVHADDDAEELILIQIIEHLQNQSFYIVAAGQVESVCTLYAFASGNESGSRVQFLLELRLNLQKNPYWSLDCVFKCSRDDLHTVFVKRTALASVFRLVK